MSGRTALFASYQCSHCTRLCPPPNTHEEARGGGGTRGSDRRPQHKGSLAMYPWCKSEGSKDQSLTRPTAAAERTAAPFFFCLLLPCLPVMRIIPASAGWQAQHGLCSGSGSGSGISTRARRSFVQATAPGTPVSSAPCETGVWTRAQ